MPLQKQPVSVNFASGLDTFTDPFQVPSGKFAALSNAVFLKEATSSYALLSKRNGFGSLTALPNASSKLITTFGDNLMAIGTDIKSYSETASLWTSKGPFLPLQLSTKSVVQNQFSQVSVDSTVLNGLVCAVYLESAAINTIGTLSSKYIVSNLSTGEPIIPPTTIVTSNGTTSAFSPKVFALGSKFVLVFDGTNGSNSHLQYMWIDSTNPNTFSSVSDISADYAPGFPASFDGVVASNTLFISWSAKSSSSVFTGSLNSSFAFTGPRTISSTYSQSRSISVCADTSGASPVIWTSYMSNQTKGSAPFVFSMPKAAATDTSLNFIVQQVDLGTVSEGSGSFGSNSAQANVATFATNGKLTFMSEDQQVIGAIRGDGGFIGNNQSGSTSFNNIIQRNVPQTISTGSSVALSVYMAQGVGIASKPFSIASVHYIVSEYQSPNQSTYFLISSSGYVYEKLAYGNGFGTGTTFLSYLPYGYPSATTIGSNSVLIPYLFKDSVASVNKNTNVSSTTQVVEVFANTGIGVSRTDFGSNGLQSLEAGKNLNINGGYLWAYDGTAQAEYGFHLFPDSIQAVSGSGSITGGMVIQSYFYQATYEWTDNQGNTFISAPSVPVNVTVTSNSSSCAVLVPNLTLTGKRSQPSIGIYRWSTAQQSYFKVTSIPVQGPVSYSAGNPGVFKTPYVTFIDTLSDAQILGNQLLYTTGGVVENSSPPATSSMTLFDSRMWTINAEDPNQLWYSKQIITGTPVEFSDLFTLFVPPSTSVAASTGPMRCIAPMDDKLIIFKNNSLFYINGTGPDSTGANNQYSPPIFITNGVGCTNQNSIVLIPNGLMFQSSKGIWLLKRDMSVEFIGKEAEAYDGAKVLSASLIPDTNQVRFTLDSGIMLMYDYFVNQWGTFNINGISSTIYSGLHTYLDSSGNVFRETLNSYSDGSTGVVMSFTTGWISVAGLQGYKRLYRMFVLGSYKSPHSLNGTIAYDFGAITQSFQINPTNTTGSGSQVEQWQINFNTQQCQSFQLSMTEVSSVSAGAGLTISGLRIIAGVKAEAPKNIGISNKIS